MQPKVRPRPYKRRGYTVSKATPSGTAHITMNEDEEAQPFEVFLEIGKAGSDIKAMAEAMGRLMSLILAHGFARIAGRARARNRQTDNGHRRRSFLRLWQTTSLELARCGRPGACGKLSQRDIRQRIRRARLGDGSGNSTDLPESRNRKRRRFLSHRLTFAHTAATQLSFAPKGAIPATPVVTLNVNHTAQFRC